MPVCQNEFRCDGCGKLLFKGIVVEGEIEIKCRQCHGLTRVVRTQFNDLLCLISPCPNRVTVPKS